MSKLPSFTSKKLIKILKKFGFFNRVTDTWCQSRGGAFSGSIEIGGQKRLKCLHPEFGAIKISEYSVFIGQKNNLFFDFWCSDLSKSKICDQILSSFKFIEKSEKITKKEESCVEGIIEGSIMKEIKDESLHSLILEVVTQELQNLGYEKEEICKIQRYIFTAPLGLGGKVDLNEDGISEFIISLDCFYIEDKPHCIGGTGGSPIFVFGFIQGKWKLIGRLEGTRVIALKTRRVDGYFNLVTHSPMGT
jgi:L-rhamnose mutarotase